MRTVALLLTLTIASFAQTSGIVTSGSRTVVLAPEEVTFNISLVTELGTSLEQAIARVQDAGVRAGDLLYVMTTNEYSFGPASSPRVAYAFTMLRPWAELKEVADKLASARQRAAVDGEQLQFVMYGNASEQTISEARREVWTALVSELRAKAEATAAAVNLSLGPMLSIGDTPSAGTSPGAVIPVARLLPGGPYAGTIRITFSLWASFAAQPK